MPVGVKSAAFAVEPVGFVVYGTDTECRVAATGTPKGVEEAFVMSEEEKVDAANCNRGEPDARIFACDHGCQAAYQCKEQDDQSECVDRLVAQVFQIP